MTKVDLDPPYPEVTPAPIRHAHKVWGLLLAQATTEIVEIPLSDDKLECLVFRGKVGDIFSLAGVSKTYYSVVRKILTDCGAITMIQRGTTHELSVLVLDPDRPPPNELPDNVKSHRKVLTDPDRFDTLERRVQVIEKQTGGLSIVEAFRNFELRLLALEGKRETGES